MFLAKKREPATARTMVVLDSLLTAREMIAGSYDPAVAPRYE